MNRGDLKSFAVKKYIAWACIHFSNRADATRLPSLRELRLRLKLRLGFSRGASRSRRQRPGQLS